MYIVSGEWLVSFNNGVIYVEEKLENGIPTYCLCMDTGKQFFFKSHFDEVAAYEDLNRIIDAAQAGAKFIVI